MNIAQEREFFNLVGVMESQINELEFEYALEADDGENTSNEISEATKDAKKGFFKRALSKLKKSEQKIKNNIQSNDVKKLRKTKILITALFVALLAIIGALIIYIRKQENKEIIRFRANIRQMGEMQSTIGAQQAQIDYLDKFVSEEISESNANFHAKNRAQKELASVKEVNERLLGIAKKVRDAIYAQESTQESMTNASSESSREFFQRRLNNDMKTYNIVISEFISVVNSLDMD